jgi:hypothetical protein
MIDLGIAWEAVLCTIGVAGIAIYAWSRRRQERAGKREAG